MPSGYGLDASTIDLRQVGRAVQAQPDDCCLETRGLKADIGKSEVDHEQLDQRRRAAKELDIGNGQKAQDTPGRYAQESNDEPEDESEEKRSDGNCDRLRQAAKQSGQEVPSSLLDNLPKTHGRRPASAFLNVL